MKWFQRTPREATPGSEAAPSSAPVPDPEDAARKPDYRDRQYRALAARCAMGDIAAMMDLSLWHLSHARPSTQTLLREYDNGLERFAELSRRCRFDSPDWFSLKACITWRCQAARYGHEEARKLVEGSYLHRTCGILQESTHRVGSYGSELYYSGELNRLGLTDIDSGLSEFGMHSLLPEGIFVAYYQSGYCPADEYGFGREDEYASLFYDEFFNRIPGKTIEEARRNHGKLLKKREAYWANPAHDAPRRKYRRLHSQGK